MVTGFYVPYFAFYICEFTNIFLSSTIDFILLLLFIVIHEYPAVTGGEGEKED